MQQIGLDAVLNNVPDFTGGIDKMNRAVDSFASNGKQAGADFGGGFGEIVTGALRHIGTLAVDALIKAGQAVTSFVKDSIGLAGDFEAGMLSFQSVAGQDVDAKGLEQFRDLFLDIGKRLPVSTSDVQKAAIEMVKGGIDPAIIAAGGLERNIQFAAAAMDGDLVKAAEISSKILGGWSNANATAAEQTAFLTHSQDLLAKAANASATDVEGLSRGIFQSQGIAKTAGVSFDDLTTTLALLAPRFASSAEAGTSVKNMIARLQPTTKPAIAAMKELGLYTDATGTAFYDASGNFVGFEKASALLQESLKGMTKEQQAAALQTIFGNDAMGAAAALADGGAAAYANMVEKLNTANGVNETAALKQQGFNTALDNTKGSIETLQIRIGSALMPLLADLMNNYITPAINAVTNFAESFLKMVPAIAASDDPIQTFLNALKIAAPGLVDFIVAIEDIKDAITPAVQEIMRLADALSTGGLGGLIDAVVADITAALPDIEAALLGWGQAFVDWIAPMIPPALQALGDMAGAAWDWVKGQAPAWGKQLLVWGDELVAWIAPMIPPAMAELGKLGTQLLTWIGDHAAPLLKKFNDWATSFVAWIPGATVTFLAEWPKMFDQFLDWVGNAAGPLLKQLGDWALSFIQWIAPMIPPFLVALGGVALAIGVWVIETAAVLSKKIVEVWVPAILGWIVTDAIPGLVRALDSFLKVFDGWIKDAEAALARSMIAVGTSIVEGIQKGISNAWEGLKKWLADKISHLPLVGQAAQDGGSPAMIWTPVGESIVQGIMLGLDDTWPQLTDMVGNITADLVDSMGDIGSRINDAIADGFSATATIDRQLAKNMQSLAKIPEGFYRTATTNALKNAQDIASTYADPAIGAKFFALKSKQIMEFQDLQQDINAETNAETKAQLQAQQSLILSAQEAEMRAFEQTNSRVSSPMQNIADQVNEIMKVLAGINLTDDQIHVVDALAGIFGALSAPVSSPYQTPGGSVAYNTQSTTLNMPIYTNNTPGAMQDSMAVAGAALL